MANLLSHLTWVAQPPSAQVYNVIRFFFQTDWLAPGSYKLNVVYQGNAKTAPLTFYELFLQNHASTTVTLTSSPSSTTNGIYSPSLDTKNHSSNLGPIIRGVIGGLALIIFAVLAILFLRRRNNRSQESLAVAQPFLDPSMAVPSSFTQHSSSDNFRPTA
jgi:hypothetical protein